MSITGSLHGNIHRKYFLLIMEHQDEGRVGEPLISPLLMHILFRNHTQEVGIL